MPPPRVAPWPVVAAVLLGLPAGAAAQLTRLANDEPEIRARTGGRLGACDVVRFSPDGQTLFAVGEDKVVHRWAVGPARLTPQAALYWNTFRERRGSIYALAVSPDGTTAAVGGLGKRDADVALFDLRAGRLVGALSAGDPARGYPNPHTVWALAFRPDGRELAVGDDAGGVWTCPLVWGRPTQAKAVVPAERAVRHGSRVIWVGYLPDGRLAYAKRDGGVYAVGRAEPLFRWGNGPVDMVVASHDGTRLAARPAAETPTGSSVEVRSLPDGKDFRAIVFPRGRFPDRAALDADGSRLAVGVADRAAPALAKAEFWTEPAGQLQVYDLRPDRPALIAEAAEVVDQVCFHPDGKRLATADRLDHGTSLWGLGDRALSRVAREQGEGRALWAVGLSEKGDKLVFKDRLNPAPAGPNDRGAGDWTAFDLDAPRRGWSAPGPVVPAAPVETLKGWGVRFAFDPKDGFICEALPPNGGPPQRLPLDPLRDDAPRCYTFLPAPGGPADAVRLAVGHYWGVSVFDLSASHPPRLARKLMGHAGSVTAIAPAYGGAGLVTAGRDGVIALWNLAPFPAQPLLGAAFGEKDGRFRVTAVDRGSPADEAGLSVGDEVRNLWAGGDEAPVPRADWPAALKDPRPGRELLFEVANDRFPDGAETKTLLLHRPAARFLPLRNGEWVLYTYRQSYYDASPNGGRFVEWLVSKPRAADPPEVFPVDRFARFLRRPDKVAEVVAKLGREPGKPLLPDLFPPDVSVRPAANEVKDGEDVKVTVAVTPRRRHDGKVNRVARVELWVNGHHRAGVDPLAGRAFADADGNPLPFEVTFTVPAKALRPGANVLEAVGIGSDNPADAAGSPKSRPVRVTLRSDKPAERRLWGLVAGIRRYHGWGGDLPSVDRDVSLMQKVWEGVRPDGFTGVSVRDLRDAQVTRARLLDRIKEVGAEAGPDDLFVLFLAGHGVLSEKLGPAGGSWLYVIPQAADGTPLPKAAGKELLADASLTDAALRDALAALRCRKLVLLDCCHAGAAGPGIAGTANAGGELAPDGFGPLVLSACQANEESYGVEADDGGNGLFTRRVAAALGPDFAAADADHDGRLTVGELYEAVRAGTARDAGDRGKRQTPAVTPAPSDLLGAVLVVRPAAK